jgi:hypothetical protein
MIERNTEDTIQYARHPETAWRPVVIKPKTKEEMTRSGIVLPDTRQRE